MNLQKRSNARVNDAHWTLLMSYMEAHPSLATGKIQGPNGKQRHIKIWEELSSELNALGYGTKTREKWQKTWVDYKQNLKKKVSMIKREMTATGSGPGQMHLSEFEDRVLDLLGSTYCEETDRSTLEVEILPTSNSARPIAKENAGFSTDRLPTLIANIPPIAGNNHEISGNAAREEHNYSTKKRKMGEHEETIHILKNINNSISRGLADINATLRELCNAIKDRNP